MKRKFSHGGGESMIGVGLFCVVAFLTHAVDGSIRCYVCSWHSPTTYGSMNITDTCSHYNFNPDYSHTIECEKGCEAVSIRKSNNGEMMLVNFYKNCIPASKPTSQLEDKCFSKDDQLEHVTTCECTSDFCNAGRRRMEYEGAATLCILATLVIFSALYP